MRQIDNRARTSGDVRLIFDKNGGNMGLPGCVGYLFEKKGLILIDATAYPDEDAVMTAALEAEADDFKREEAVYVITCDPTKFSPVYEAIKAGGYEPLEAEVKSLPKAYTEVDVETGKKVAKLMDLLDANDDVQNVYTTADLTPEMTG